MMPPLSIYLHLPWCIRKCPYCDFNSHKAGDASDRRRYIDALRKDLRLEALRADTRTIETVFLGGGTPSYFSAGEIEEIIAAIASLFHLSKTAEITMEANPGTLERDKLDAYRRAGINRLSLGAQSFSDESLRRLGRIHSADDILTAWRDAEKACFDSVNLDLMFALPGQSLEMALRDVRQAVALSPQHVSWYQLTLEPNTIFHARPPEDLPDEDLSWAIEERGKELLCRAGYRQYETSAFAMPGHSCRHNLNYWTFGDYLAVGAGAHGKFSDQDGRVWRYRKPLHPLTYMNQNEAGSLDCALQQLAPAELVFEFMLNALRLNAGFSADDFTARTGLPHAAILPGLRRAGERGLIETIETLETPAGRAAWRPTARGARFLNDLQALFLPSDEISQDVVPGIAPAGGEPNAAQIGPCRPLTGLRPEP